MFISPQCIPSGSFTSQSSHSPSSAIFPWQVTVTLEPTFCNNSRCYNRRAISPTHSKTQCQVSPGTLVTVHPCPHGDRRATHYRWSAFIFHGQVQSTICPCETAGKPPTPSLWVFLLRTCKPPNKHQAHSFKEVTCVAFTAHPQGSKCFHTVLNLQENEVSSTSWDTAFTVLFY